MCKRRFRTVLKGFVHSWLAGDASLNNHVFDATLVVDIDAIFIHPLVQLSQRPFHRIILVFSFSRLDERFALLVDRIVGQVHKVTGQIFRVIAVILTAESNQTLGVQIDAEWLKAPDEHIYAQIVLLPVDQVRIGDVLADDVP